MLVRFDHIARFIVNANHGVMWAAVGFSVIDYIAGSQRATPVFAAVRFAFSIQTAQSKESVRLMKQNENYDGRDDLLHRRTSERMFNLFTIFSFVSLASLGPRIVVGTPTIERDLCRAAVLLRFALLSPEYEPEINLQSSH